MSMNSLKQFITTLRHAKTPQDETIKAQNQLRTIYELFTTHGGESSAISNYQRRNQLCKLLYVDLSGLDLQISGVEDDGFVKCALQQCLILISSEITTDITIAGTSTGNVESMLREVKQDREIGYLLLKSLFELQLTDDDVIHIVDSILADVRYSDSYGDGDSDGDYGDAIGTVVGITLQGFADLLPKIHDMVMRIDPVRTHALVDALFNKLKITDATTSTTVCDFVRIRVVMCLSQLVKYRVEEPYLLKRGNLAEVGRLLGQLSLNNVTVSVALIDLIQQWLKCDWDGVKMLEGLITTKLREILSVVSMKSMREMEEKGENEEKYGWILKYGSLVIKILDTLSLITTVKGTERTSILRNDVDSIIGNCVGVRARLFNDVGASISSLQLTNASMLNSALRMYTNDIEYLFGSRGEDVDVVVDAIVPFLRSNDNVNIRLKFLRLLLSVLRKSTNLGHARKSILSEPGLWKRFVLDRDSEIGILTSQILVESVNVKKVSEDSIIFSQIKDVVVLLLYYLQACKHLARGVVLSKILTILENYKDTGIVEESMRKMLKLFITIGNYNNTAWIRTFKLIEYASDKVSQKRDNPLITQMIELLCSGISQGCCENFVKLSVSLLRKNCEDWKIGDLNMQLSLIVEKYEFCSLSSKLLILDTMYSYHRVVDNEDLKTLIELAFEEESNTTNYELKQRAYEYSTLLKLGVQFDNTIDIMTLTKLPQRPPAPTHAPAPAPASAPVEVATRFLRFDQGILYDSDNMRVVFRVKRGKKSANVDMNFKLKVPMEDPNELECSIKENSIDEKLFKLTVQSSDGIDAEKASTTFSFTFELNNIYDIEKEPIFDIRFRGKKVSMQLPLALKMLRTSEGNSMPAQVFESRWDQLGKITQLCYKSRQLKLNSTLAPLIDTLSRYLVKMNFEILPATVDEDGNRSVILCAGLLSSTSTTTGVLARIASDGVAVRCTNSEGGAAMIAERLVYLVENTT